MGPFEMVVGIVLIVTIGGIMRARYKAGHHIAPLRLADDPEAQRMREEIKMLRDRVAVLERIATDKGSSLEREIELLRDR